MQKRRRITFGAAAVALLTAAPAIGMAATASSASASSPTSFTYWTSGWKPSEIATIDSAFDKAYPAYRPQGQYISTSDTYFPKVIAALKTNTQPTVYTDQQPYDLPIVQESGKLIPLTGKLARAHQPAIPGDQEVAVLPGPAARHGSGGVGDIALFYNKTDFAQAGITSPPTTWAQLAADAAKLTDPSAHRYGFYVPTGDAEWISYDWEPVLWGDGGSLLNANQTKATFDSAAGIKALSTWVNMVRSQKVAPTASYAADGNFDGPTAFASNAVAMITDGPWLEGEVPKGLDYGVAPYPAGSAGGSTNIGIGVVALLKTTPAEDQAGPGLHQVRGLAGPGRLLGLADRAACRPARPRSASRCSSKRSRPSGTTSSPTT